MNLIHTVLYVFLCLDISFSLKGSDCINNLTKEPECCDNFILVNGICTECKNGTYSYRMKICKPCEANTYGYKCIKACQCGDKSWCDPVTGCILTTATVGQSIPMSTQTKYSVTDFDKTVNNSQSEGIKQIKATDTDHTLYIYMGCAAGVIVILVLVHILQKRIISNQENRAKASVDDDEQPEPDSVQPDTDLDHYLYVEIDDTRI